MENKITLDFVMQQYQSGISSYSHATLHLGLWQSEKYVYEKYLTAGDTLLDLGCGTGRTTFALYNLGYKNITGVDVTPAMIQEAERLSRQLNLPVPFIEGNALHLPFKDGHFTAAIFSFNGIMSIPQAENRKLALNEIYRVLQPGSVFIFTTHDRDMDPNYLAFWEAEKQKWESGGQDAALHDFGDIITVSKNETAPIYIHIPNRQEVKEYLAAGGFEVLETFYRNEKFEEAAAVKQKSGECRFWVARRKQVL